MKKRASKENTEEKKGFVWISLRISFYLMLFLLVLSFFVSFAALNLIFLYLLLFAIVVSIIHLFKHKRKAFAISSLIILVLISLFYILGLVSQTAG